MPTLTGPRLLLRDFRLDDEDELHAVVGEDAVTRYTDWGPNSRADTRAFLTAAVAQPATSGSRTCFSLAAVELSSAELVGSAELDVQSPRHRRGELGFVFARSRWGMGYATEAAGLLLGFGFGHLGLHRIAATCHPDNTASARVLEKVGMGLEGRLRDHLLVRGRWRDSLVYARIGE